VWDFPRHSPKLGRGESCREN